MDSLSKMSSPIFVLKKKDHTMNKRFQLSLSIPQIVVGVLATLVFIKNIFTSGEIKMTLLAFVMMLLGLIQGISGLRKSLKD